MLVRLFIVAALCYQNVKSDIKQLCSYEDSNYCIVNGAKRMYKELMNSDIKGVPVSDPVFTDLIEADLPTVKYTLRNVTFAGAKTCTPELFELNAKDMTYHYHLACEHVVIDGVYEMKGKLGPIDVEGQGDVKVDIYDYIFLINGVMEQKLDEDQKSHLRIKLIYKLDMDVRGKVVYEFKNLFDDDKEKSVEAYKFINENSKEVDKIIRQPIMEKFMSILVYNANMYFDKVPIERAFSGA